MQFLCLFFAVFILTIGPRFWSVRRERDLLNVIHPTYYRYLIYRSASPFLLSTGEAEVVELLE